jgi:hypothetical protein
VQFNYLNKLVADKQISEVHLWNYAREISDSIWLKSLFGIENPWIYTAAKHEYRRVPFVKLFGESSFRELELNINASHDAHILLYTDKAAHILLYTDKANFYEIVLGGWNNAKSVIRNQQGILSQNDGPFFSKNKWTPVKITLNGNIIQVFANNVVILTYAITSQPMFNVFVAGFRQHSVDFDFQPMSALLPVTRSSTTINTNVYKLISPPNKWTWIDYYAYYTKDRFPNHIIIKADDDIVYIDTDGFAQFVQNRINDTTSLLAFPSIINNGVCAYYQQKWELVPLSVGEFPYDTYQGLLWSKAQLCFNLHKYFINNYKSFVQKSKTYTPIAHPMGDRISINFFAVLSKDLDIFQDIIKYTTYDLDDEQHISVTMSKVRHRRHYIDPVLTVSHLSFFKQVENGLDEPKLLDDYMLIAKNI